mmetsp:Transcript_28867/g.85273  ORF Transcript_28867/g.85273 Transcript_28867/m.85273 type:complete len:457 (-) Transcript_28867:621-1991(-)
MDPRGRLGGGERRKEPGRGIHVLQSSLRPRGRLGDGRGRIARAREHDRGGKVGSDDDPRGVDLSRRPDPKDRLGTPRFRPPSKRRSGGGGRHRRHLERKSMVVRDRGDRTFLDISRAARNRVPSDPPSVVGDPRRYESRDHRDDGHHVGVRGVRSILARGYSPQGEFSPVRTGVPSVVQPVRDSSGYLPKHGSHGGVSRHSRLRRRRRRGLLSRFGISRLGKEGGTVRNVESGERAVDESADVSSRGGPYGSRRSSSGVVHIDVRSSTHDCRCGDGISDAAPGRILFDPMGYVGTYIGRRRRCDRVHGTALLPPGAEGAGAVQPPLLAGMGMGFRHGHQHEDRQRGRGLQRRRRSRDVREGTGGRGGSGDQARKEDYGIADIARAGREGDRDDADGVGGEFRSERERVEGVRRRGGQEGGRAARFGSSILSGDIRRPVDPASTCVLPPPPPLPVRR